MTSSDRHLKLGQPRWNFNSQVYKNIDNEFFEPGLFSILFLAHGRPEVTKRSFYSTLDCVKQYSGEVEWIFVENGKNEANDNLFKGFDSPRAVTIRQNNFGINEGFNQAWAVSRGEWCFIHENDWECRMNLDFLSIVKDIFNENSNIGIVQLRDPRDPNDNHGLNKPIYNPWSCNQQLLDRAKIKIWKESTKAGYEYLVSEFPNGFNNNPIVMRKSIYHECGPYPEPEVGHDPRHGETLYQDKVGKLGCAIAHIGMPLYRHIGAVQTQGI